MKRLAAILLTAGILAGSAGAATLTYHVRPGDTLIGIATAHHLTLRQLVRLNDLDPGAVLQIGATLRLPAPRPAVTRYRVVPGDTLSGIAGRAGTSVAAIARLNRLDPAKVLPAGAILLLPAGKREAAGPTRDAIRGAIRHWAAHYRIRGALALALAWQESGDQPGVVSKAGALGVMQVMPATWPYVEVLIGHPVPHTTFGNIRIGIAYFHHLLHAFAGNESLALAGYLQGETSVRTNGILPSSRSYVANILALAS
jgi:soluble lytic murein transglycosylase-like protein